MDQRRKDALKAYREVFLSLYYHEFIQRADVIYDRKCGSMKLTARI